jgi:hypothetical protein
MMLTKCDVDCNGIVVNFTKKRRNQDINVIRNPNSISLTKQKTYATQLG